ncbi:MAG: ATP-dependent RecD-like DNA helicase [Lentisphaerota bacterium]
MAANPSDLFSYKAPIISEKENSIQMPPLAQVEGEVQKIVYTNEDESYSVVRVHDKHGSLLTLTGPLAGVFEGQGIKASGKWEKHQEYGQYLKVENFSFTLPRTREGIEKYISSGLIHGIGPKRAKMIVAQFGEKTLDILDNYSARLSEISGFGRKTIESVRKSWQEQADKREVTIFFQGLGISLAYCTRIYKQFGSNALKIVKNNPYSLAEMVSGIGFIRADNIAKNLGICHNDEKRLIAGIKYTLRKLADVGHTCYPHEEFVQINADTLEITNEESRKSIADASDKGECVIDTIFSNSKTGLFIFDTILRNSELQLASIIKSLLGARSHKGMFLNNAPPSKDNTIIFNGDQNEAINNIAKCPISIITGGPGVGKTTVVSEIIRRALCTKLKVYLAAPTGRAAKRMSEATGYRAQTIHRLLKWEPITKGFVFNQKNKLRADLIVVDECSMLDMPLAFSLFKAIKMGTTVVLVGDADQLPSVGPGNVLKDLIASSVCPVTFLKQIYRQAAQSKIISVAHLVNKGRMFSFEKDANNRLSDFYWIEQDDNEKVSDTIIKMVTERIPQRFGLDPIKDIQVLSPMSKGVCGTIALNEKLQKSLNQNSSHSFNYGNRFFKAGDKVMQTHNNYDKNVFNGDIGFISSIDIKASIFTVKYDDRTVPYDFDESLELTLAYAVTIHKSQGSEFPAVVIPCVMSHYIMLQRNLLYTGVSRAKKLLVLIGSKKAVSIAILNFQCAPRFTCLHYHLTQS